MGFESFFSKSQLSLDDHKLLHNTEEFQGTYTQFMELERMNDLVYLSVARSIIAIKSRFEKMVEERMTSSHESSLGPICAYE